MQLFSYTVIWYLTFRTIFTWNTLTIFICKWVLVSLTSNSCSLLHLNWSNSKSWITYKSGDKIFWQWGIEVITKKQSTEITQRVSQLPSEDINKKVFMVKFLVNSKHFALFLWQLQNIYIILITDDKTKYALKQFWEPKLIHTFHP